MIFLNQYIHKIKSTLYSLYQMSLSLQNNSVSPSDSLRASEKHRASSDYSLDSKKRKMEEKDNLRYVRSAYLFIYFLFFKPQDF